MYTFIINRHSILYFENISNFSLSPFYYLLILHFRVSIIRNIGRYDELLCILTHWSLHVALTRYFLSTFPFSTNSPTCRKFFATRSRTSIVSQGAICYGYCRLSNSPAAISPISSEFEHYLWRMSVHSPESNELDELCERRDAYDRSHSIFI